MTLCVRDVLPLVAAGLLDRGIVEADANAGKGGNAAHLVGDRDIRLVEQELRDTFRRNIHGSDLRLRVENLVAFANDFDIDRQGNAARLASRPITTRPCACTRMVSVVSLAVQARVASDSEAR